MSKFIWMTLQTRDTPACPCVTGMAMHVFTMDSVDMMALFQGQRPRHDIAVKFCYDLADAMIAEREKHARKD